MPGHRQANAALYRAIIVRMRLHQPTKGKRARRAFNAEFKAKVIKLVRQGLRYRDRRSGLTGRRFRGCVTRLPATRTGVGEGAADPSGLDGPTAGPTGSVGSAGGAALAERDPLCVQER